MSEEMDSSGGDLCSVDFEIFGYVQGVCFRMYTERKGLDLGLVGWVKNTSKGTVVGQVQGPRHLINEIFLQDDAFCSVLCNRDQTACSVFPLYAGVEKSIFPNHPSDCLPFISTRKVWLSKEGSPFCRISRAVFNNERDIPKLELSGFSTRF